MEGALGPSALPNLYLLFFNSTKGSVLVGLSALVPYLTYLYCPLLYLYY